MRQSLVELFQPGLQSVFRTGGPHADSVSQLAWLMFGGGAVIFVGVLALTVYAIWGPRGRRGWTASERFVVGAGLVFPGVALAGLLTYSLSLSPIVAPAPQPGDLRIEITGEQWWWRVHYLDERGRIEFATANEVRLPAGRPVELVLKAGDVIHSFWVPGLAGKADMIPGRSHRLRVTADRTGLFRGQCAEYCGGPHAKMALYVVAVPAGEFEQWRAAQRGPLATTEDDGDARRLFVRFCGACHTVRGTAAAGRLGPDLTHVGSRLSLAAGILPNNLGALNAWISGSQEIKPGNLMPSMNVIGAAEVQAIAAWLDQLK
jgi:cytochrome c oxidase subunit 2